MRQSVDSRCRTCRRLFGLAFKAFFKVISLQLVGQLSRRFACFMALYLEIWTLLLVSNVSLIHTLCIILLSMLVLTPGGMVICLFIYCSSGLCLLFKPWGNVWAARVSVAWMSALAGFMSIGLVIQDIVLLHKSYLIRYSCSGWQVATLDRSFIRFAVIFKVDITTLCALNIHCRWLSFHLVTLYSGWVLSGNLQRLVFRFESFRLIAI